MKLENFEVSNILQKIKLPKITTTRLIIIGTSVTATVCALLLAKRFCMTSFFRYFTTKIKLRNFSHTVIFFQKFCPLNVSPFFANTFCFLYINTDIFKTLRQLIRNEKEKQIFAVIVNELKTKLIPGVIQLQLKLEISGPKLTLIII